MRQHAVSCLNEHERDIKNRGDREGGSERGRCMAMAVVVTMVVVTMMMTVVMVMRVMRRHAFDS